MRALLQVAFIDVEMADDGELAGRLEPAGLPTAEVTISFTDARSTCSSPISRMKSTLVATVGTPPAPARGLMTPCMCLPGGADYYPLVADEVLHRRRHPMREVREVVARVQ